MSKIRLHGSSSGYTEIAPVAASGNNTLTLPDDGTIISKDSNGAVGVTSITVGTGVTIGDGRITCTTLHGSAANCTSIPAANIVGVCTSGSSKTGGFGKILQVVSQNLTTQMSTASTSYVDSGLTASITPSATSNKILILINIGVSISGDHNGYLKLLRDSTEINSGSGGDNNSLFGVNGNSTASRYATMMEACNFLDSPSTTSAITYKVQVRSHSGSHTMYINRRSNDTNFGVASNITLVEVEA